MKTYKANEKNFLKVIVLDAINEKFGDVNNVVNPGFIEEFEWNNLKAALDKDIPMSVNIFQQWCVLLNLEVEINVK